jgi:hypothetical protein
MDCRPEAVNVVGALAQEVPEGVVESDAMIGQTEQPPGPAREITAVDVQVLAAVTVKK